MGLSLGPHGIPDVGHFMHFNQLLSFETRPTYLPCRSESAE